MAVEGPHGDHPDLFNFVHVLHHGDVVCAWKYCMDCDFLQ